MSDHARQQLPLPKPAAPALRLQRKCECGSGGSEPCACPEEEQAQRSALDGRTGSVAVPPLDRSAGQALPGDVQSRMERAFAFDFGRVRVHAGGQAAEAAQSVHARAYTVGNEIVFGAGQYAPRTSHGARLLAHELTHVVQQSTGAAASLDDGVAEREADRVADAVGEGTARAPAIGAAASPSRLYGQFITPLGQGGGFGGLLERGRVAAGLNPAAVGAAFAPTTPFQVCSRDLQGFLGLFANHAYIEAPPKRYAIISPLCPASPNDGPIRGTTAQKWDNSPDPCGKSPNCVPCNPAPGVTDVGACLRGAFSSYASLSLYKGLGPNSNTFAGTLARTCCAGMVPKPPALGTVPGWDDPPAPARAGATPCPPGPSCT